MAQPERIMLRALTLLALALLLSSAGAAPDLNGRPPDFTLKAADGQTVHLRSVLGRSRLLIALAPDEAALREVQAAAQGYLDRDLRVLAVVPPGATLLTVPWAAPITVLSDPGGKVQAAYGGAKRSYLIGKDGGIKGVYGGLPGAQELFATIDGMPMRQQERRERGR